MQACLLYPRTLSRPWFETAVYSVYTPVLPYSRTPYSILHNTSTTRKRVRSIDDIMIARLEPKCPWFCLTQNALYSAYPERNDMNDSIFNPPLPLFVSHGLAVVPRLAYSPRNTHLPRPLRPPRSNTAIRLSISLNSAVRCGVVHRRLKWLTRLCEKTAPPCAKM